MASAPASHSGRKAHPTLVAATELPIYVASTAPTEPEAAVPVHSKPVSAAQTGVDGGAHHRAAAVDSSLRSLTMDLRHAAARASLGGGSGWPGTMLPAAGLALLGALLAYRVGTRRRSRSKGYEA